MNVGFVFNSDNKIGELEAVHMSKAKAPRFAFLVFRSPKTVASILSRIEEGESEVKFLIKN